MYADYMSASKVSPYTYCSDVTLHLVLLVNLMELLGEKADPTNSCLLKTRKAGDRLLFDVFDQ